MNKFFIVLSHTFLSKVKTRSFIITTAIMVGIIYLMANITNIIDYFNKDEVGEQIIVLAEKEEFFHLYQEQMLLSETNLSFINFQGTAEEAEREIIANNYDGMLIINVDENSLPVATYKALTVSDTMLLMELEAGLQQVKTSLAAAEMNLTADQLSKIYERIEFDHVALKEDAKSAEELNQARGLVYVLLFVIYITVIMYANMIATEVATEKSSRVMEILVSSVPPITQMFGKIIGIALLGLAQLSIISIAGYVAIKKNLQSLNEGFFSYMGFGNISVITIIYAIVFFLLGYLLYAMMAALLGSLVSRIEEVNQLIAPMTFLIIIGFVIAMLGLERPDSTFITVTSYIPFFTPMIMFLRVGMLTIPTWEVALGIGILIVTIIALAVFGSRVYRGGVLMYGKSSSIKDITKAIQLTKKS